jgi:hypothetical protein
LSMAAAICGSFSYSGIYIRVETEDETEWEAEFVMSVS